MQLDKLVFKPAGDAAVVLQWCLPVTPELNRHITACKDRLEQCSIVGIEDIVPAYSTLLIYYNPVLTEYNRLVEEIKSLFLRESEKTGVNEGKTVVIPVFYGGRYGPDLESLAETKGLAVSEVVKRHCQAVYQVYMIGFLPGFPYLGFVDESISMGRRKEPRELVSAGSVGIAGRQTGIYSLNSPGGWQIIGRTPIRLFHAEKGRFLLRAGDTVIFKAVDEGIGFSDINPDAWGDLYGNDEGH